jgi:hypothetical protein
MIIVCVDKNEKGEKMSAIDEIERGEKFEGYLEGLNWARERNLIMPGFEKQASGIESLGHDVKMFEAELGEMSDSQIHDLMNVDIEDVINYAV